MEELGRRTFLTGCIKGLCACVAGSAVLRHSDSFAGTDTAIPLSVSPDKDQKSGKTLSRFTREAMEYVAKDNGLVQCTLCPKMCIVAPDMRGICGVRENIGGTYYTLVHSRVCAAHVDPIEKKPLFHFKPGSSAFSLATPGCNFTCTFCQNWQISQAKPEDIRSQYVSPADVVSAAKGERCQSIAYTYTEPTIFYEMMYETAKIGNEAGIDSVSISNGYIAQPALEKLLDHLKAIKIDLKAFTDSFYRTYCAGELKPVLDAIKTIRAREKWLEIVVLIIPTLNDNPKEIDEMARWIAGEIGPDVPIHFSRFHPQYKLKNLPVTPMSTLNRCVEICKEHGLRYIYVGNAPGHPNENTYCPSCSKPVISRYGYFIRSTDLKDGNCGACGHKIAGVF